MTAEERADELADALFDVDCGVTGEGREVIAKFIRAAEDEALERAAVACEAREAEAHGFAEQAPTYAGGAEESARMLAATIRSLKSQVPPPTPRDAP